MRRAGVVSLVVAVTGCTVFGGVDDLSGKPDASLAGGNGGSAGSSADAAGGAAGNGGTSACTPATQCFGCPSCSDYCQCATPFDVDACVLECSGGDDAGSDAAGGAAGADNCSDASLHGKSCSDATTWGGTACRDCMQAACCTEIESCLADEQCARFWQCYTTHCQSASDISCASNECGSCLAISPLTPLTQCISNSCSTECGV